MKVFIVNGSFGYHRLFTLMGHQIVDSHHGCELMVFTGGEDVSPELYGDKAHQYTGNSPYRDSVEKEYFQYAQANSIPCVGICRGGQFLNVMSGGRMYQHVEGHTRSHEITDLLTGETVLVSSTHHQMMMPSSRGLLVASSGLGGAREWFDGQIARRDVSKEDIEVVYYEHTKSLCFQPHPEFLSEEYKGMYFYFEGLLSRFLGIKSNKREKEHAL